MLTLLSDLTDSVVESCTVVASVVDVASDDVEVVASSVVEDVWSSESEVCSLEEPIEVENVLNL